MTPQPEHVWLVYAGLTACTRFPALAGFLVMEVVPLVARVLMGFGEQHHCFAPAMTALLPPRDAPLGTLQRHLGHAEDTWVGNLAPIRQGRERFQAEVNARLLASEGQRLDGHVRTRERDVPAVRFPADRDGLGCALNGTGPMDTDAPNLRQGEEAIIQPGAIAVLLEGEAVEAVAALEAWEAGLLAPLHAAEERLVGLVEAGEHILEDVGVDGRVFGERGAHGLQFSFLLKAGDGSVAPLPGGDALLQRGVVEIAAPPEHVVQRPLLGRRRAQLLFVRLAHGLA